MAEAVGEKLEVYVDGGVRGGIDIIKALAFGARGVMIGRPWIWALAGAGEVGLVNYLRRSKANSKFRHGAVRCDARRPNPQRAHRFRGTKSARRSPPATKVRKRRMSVMEFDYVIVGGGAGGCILAGRLSEDPSVSACLLEAGGPDKGVLIPAPLGFAAAAPFGLNTARYETVPQPQLNGRRGLQPRGRLCRAALRSLRCCRFLLHDETGASCPFNGLGSFSAHPVSVSFEAEAEIFRFQLTLIDRSIDRTMSACLARSCPLWERADYRRDVEAWKPVLEREAVFA